MNVQTTIRETYRHHSSSLPSRTEIANWVAASILTGYLLSLLVKAVGGSFSLALPYPEWMTIVQASILFGGVWTVSIGLAGVAVARRFGRGRIAGVGVASAGTILTTIIYGTLQLPYQQRMGMWKAIRYWNEYQAYILAALVVVVVVTTTMYAFGVGIYSLLAE